MRLTILVLAAVMSCTALFEDDFESGNPITTNYVTPWFGTAAHTANGIGVGGGWGAEWAGSGIASHVDFSLKASLFPIFTINADGSVDFCYHADYKPDPSYTDSDGNAIFEFEQHHWNPASSVLSPILSITWDNLSVGGGAVASTDLVLYDKDFNELDRAPNVFPRDGSFHALRVEGTTSTFTAGFGNSDGSVSVYVDDVLVLSATGADFWVFDPNGGLGSENRFGFAVEPSGVIDNIVLGQPPVSTPVTGGTAGPYAWMEWPRVQP